MSRCAGSSFSSRWSRCSRRRPTASSSQQPSLAHRLAKALALPRACSVTECCARGRPAHRRDRLRAQRVAAARPRLGGEAPDRVHGARRAGADVPLPDRGARRGDAERHHLARQPDPARLRRPDPLVRRSASARPEGARRRDPHACRDGSSATSRSSTSGAPAPGWKSDYYINECPPISALIVGPGDLPWTPDTMAGRSGRREPEAERCVRPAFA